MLLLLVGGAGLLEPREKAADSGAGRVHQPQIMTVKLEGRTGAEGVRESVQQPSERTLIQLSHELTDAAASAGSWHAPRPDSSEAPGQSAAGHREQRLTGACWDPNESASIAS